jgi:hypothetical protein
MKPRDAPRRPRDYSKSKWRVHWEKVARENTYLKTNRDRQKKACEEWLKISKNPLHRDCGKSRWRIHWEKVARDNPHLKTNRDRQKKACEEWEKFNKPL